MAPTLEEDLSCSVCCEVFRDPRLLPCGHSFCGTCVDRHWAVDPARTCPVCRRPSLQNPPANLVLRNACESFLKEKEGGSDGEVRCSQHGEKLNFFCRTDGEAICSECRKQTHSSHRVQNITHTVRQRKNQIREALHPAEKALKALKNGTSQDVQLAKYIESQAQQAERLIKKEFEKFRQFLCDEEDARVAALKKEADRKRGKLQKRIEREILSLSDRVQEVEEEMKNDGALFLQNFDYMLLRAEYTAPESEFSSESLINMPEHVGNLGYRVWQKMTNIFRYYPVVLDPNTGPADVSISADLVSVGRSCHERPIPVPHRGNQMVLGSEGYIDEVQCWNIVVGKSKHWTIGVCQRSTGLYHSAQLLSPETGFWGLRCKGDSYRLLASKSRSFQLRKKLRMVRVQLTWWYSLDRNIWRGWRKLTFLDADDESMIAFTDVPAGVALFPFLLPEERSSPLRIAPVDVAQTVEHKLQIEKREGNDFVYAILFLILGFIIGMFLKKE